MKIEVPPPPVPSAPLNVLPRKAEPKKSVKGDIPALDEQFVRRCLVWTLVLGACLTLLVYAVNKSVGATGSFALGVLSGAALLGSEILLIGRVLEAEAAKRKGTGSARAFLALLWIGKWVPFGIALWWLTKQEWFNAFAFALGCTVFQIVIFARAAGRLLSSYRA